MNSRSFRTSQPAGALTSEPVTVGYGIARRRRRVETLSSTERECRARHADLKRFKIRTKATTDGSCPLDRESLC